MTEMESLVDLSIKDGVELEKCVVAQHRTSLDQKSEFASHINGCPRNKIPIEWVIDIADESSGWFYGTAYDYDDTTRMLHVMVPDKLNPTFDGHVLLDYRTVHLIECVDGKSDALFNKIVRDSILKVRWELEWFEEVPPEDTRGNAVAANGVKGKWVPSVARYYIRIANQLLVEDDEAGSQKKGFVMITADFNVRLIHCSKGKGQEDFNALVNDALVQSTDAAREEALNPIPPTLTEALLAEERSSQTREKNGPSSANVNAGANAGGAGGGSSGAEGKSANPPSKRSADPGGAGADGGNGGRSGTTNSSSSNNISSASAGASASADGALLYKMLDMARDLKECMQELLEERDKTVAERTKVARAYQAFTMEGNLDAAFTLAQQMDEVIAADDRSKQSKYSAETDPRNAVAEEAWHLVTRIEKTLNKHLAGSSSSSSGGRRR